MRIGKGRSEEEAKKRGKEKRESERKQYIREGCRKRDGKKIEEGEGRRRRPRERERK